VIDCTYFPKYIRDAMNDARNETRHEKREKETRKIRLERDYRWVVSQTRGDKH
jgi:hypothetical protein